MINVSDNFTAEVFEKDNRSYQYRAVVTFTDLTSITIENEDLVESGGVVIDEAVSNDDSFDIGSCIINKLTLVLRNYDGDFDEYDFRGAKVELYFGLKINGTLTEYQRGVYNIKEIPVYDTSTITLVGYDNMVLLEDASIKDLKDTLYDYGFSTEAAATIDILDGMEATCGFQNNVTSLPFLMTDVVIPDDSFTCRDFLSYIGQMNCVNFKFDANGNLTSQWYSTGFTTESYAIRQIASDYIRIIENNVIRVSYHIEEGEVIWANQVSIPSLYSLKADKHDTIITGVRIVLNNGNTEESDGFLDSTTYVTGTDDYQISIEGNPLINADNAEDVLALLANCLIGFKYRQASFAHPGVPWVEAGDTAVIRDAKGNRHNVLISSTVFTSLDRQSTVSAGIPNAFNVPSRFSPETKAYVRTMEEMKPVISDINQQIATASGLYETTEYHSDNSAIYYLHNKQDILDSDLQIMFSDVGILLSPNALDEHPTWYGLCANGDMLANILSANGINADWIHTGSITVKDQSNNILFQISVSDKKMVLADNGETARNSTFKVIRTANSTDAYTEMFSDALNMHDGDYVLGKQDTRIYPGSFIFEQNDNSNPPSASINHVKYLVQYNRGKLQFIRQYCDANDDVITVASRSPKTMFEVDADGDKITANGIDITPSTPTFSAANGVTVVNQTWSKIGNIVVGDLSISGVTVGSTTVTLGQLSVHPGHSVIGNARTSTTVARCSIDSSGNIKINSDTSIASTTTINMTFSFVAS